MSEPIAENQSTAPADDAEHYEVRVKGHISPGLSDWFEDLKVTHLPTGETILSGLIPDQAALHGLLARIRDLNLPLISVARTDLEHSPDASDSSIR